MRIPSSIFHVSCAVSRVCDSYVQKHSQCFVCVQPFRGRVEAFGVFLRFDTVGQAGNTGGCSGSDVGKTRKSVEGINWFQFQLSSVTGWPWLVDDDIVNLTINNRDFMGFIMGILDLYPIDDGRLIISWEIILPNILGIVTIMANNGLIMVSLWLIVVNLWWIQWLIYG